jgi:small nuclear ribonucleoprotein (snRNP)-like protein
MHDTISEVSLRNSGILNNVSSHMNTVLSKAKLTHHITENSANISIMRLSFH